MVCWCPGFLCVAYSSQRLWLKSHHSIHSQQPLVIHKTEEIIKRNVLSNRMWTVWFEFLWFACLVPASGKNMSALNTAMMYLVVFLSDQGKDESQQSLTVPSSLSFSLTPCVRPPPACQASLQLPSHKCNFPLFYHIIPYLHYVCCYICIFW